MPFKVFNSGDLFTTVDIDTYIVSQGVIRCTSNTRPSQPAEGWHIYETDTDQLLVFKSGSWQRYDPEIHYDRFVYKTSDETRTSTSDADDSHLVIPAQPNSTYIFECQLFVSTPTEVRSLELDWNLPGDDGAISFSMWNARQASEEGMIDHYAYTIFQTNYFIWSNSLGHAVHIMGAYFTGDSGHPLRLRWRSSTGAAVTIHQYSWMRLIRVYDEHVDT